MNLVTLFGGRKREGELAWLRVRQLIQSVRSGDVELVDVPDPSPGPREVLVRTTWSLISPGTEQAVAQIARKSLLGKALDRPEEARKVVDKASREGIGPMLAAVRARLDDLRTPGYSSAGVVVAIGSGVEELQPGDRVGCVGADVACHAELAAVPVQLCAKLPAGFDERYGAFGALGAIAGHSVRLASVDAGSVVLVVGLGLVGQLAAQLVTAAGARAIVADTVPARVELAIALGAMAGASPDAVEETVLRASAGAGADAVVVAAASKDGQTLELAALTARDRAVISVVGDVRLQMSRELFFRKELQLRVSRSYGPGRYDATYEEDGVDYPIGYVRWTEGRLIKYFHEEVAAGRVKLDPLITHEIDFSAAPTAYAALEEPGRLAILLRYPNSPTETVAQREPTMPARASSNRARPESRLRVGLIGPGLFARSTLLPLLAEQPVDLVALAGRGGPRALAAARRFGNPRLAEAVEVLEAPDIDVVVIATRHDSHASLAAAALEQGKAVLLEKPLAIDDAGLERLTALMTRQGRIVIDLNRRFAPATREAISALAGRRDPLHVACRVNAGPLPVDHWLRNREQGGGRLVGEGCHFVDLCSALVQSRPESVAVAGLPPSDMTLPGDSFMLTIRYADGSLATISYIATGSRRMPKERIEILGAGRSLVIDDFRRLLRFGGRVRLPRLARSQDKGHGALVADAFRFFAQGGEPPIPYDDLIDTTRLCLLAREHLAERREEPAPL